MLIWVIKTFFLYNSSVYPCHLFLISSTSVRPFPYLSFVVCPFCIKCSLRSQIFLQRSLVFPILLFSSISLHCSIKKAFLSLLIIPCNSAFSWVYLSLLPFASLHYSAICQTFSNKYFAFYLVLVTICCTMLQTSIHSSSSTLPDLIS